MAVTGTDPVFIVGAVLVVLLAVVQIADWFRGW
jgi:hypothetical protein